MKLRLALSASLILAFAATRAEEKQGLVIPFKTVSVSSPVLQEVIDSVLVDEGAEGPPEKACSKRNARSVHGGTAAVIGCQGRDCQFLSIQRIEAK